MRVAGYSIRVLVSPTSRVVSLKRVVATAINGIPVRILSQHLSRSTLYELSVALVGAKTMQGLNRKYRKNNRPTDVLSFSGLESRLSMKGSPQSIGEVIVCDSVARKQARENGISLRAELARLTVHGVLHLFGYDHEASRSEAKRMFALQKRILKRLLNG